MMSELHNDDRDITDIVLEVEFQSTEGDVIERMSLELAVLEGHSSIQVMTSK